ncbi:DUF2059 domain-containing protein [Pacificoceanicola onchidii]|uniref:DUF2059 domain-containing protein n=1 Tax=Pacificoceanicola onchidii TaxID=2562685 RepID=UPI0010A6276C|nr:DUF2059 domain-containing protein [Pacificoceanicola onchidii]
MVNTFRKFGPLRAASVAVALAFATPVAAQDSMALAQEYTNLPSVQQMMDDLFSPQAMAAQVKATLPPQVTVTEAQLAEIGAVMSGALNGLRPELESTMTEVTADVFTVDELTVLIDFYKSEHGASIMAKMQPMMQQVMARLGPDMQAMQQAVTPQIVKILQGGQ